MFKSLKKRAKSRIKKMKFWFIHRFLYDEIFDCLEDYLQGNDYVKSYDVEDIFDEKKDSLTSDIEGVVQDYLEENEYVTLSELEEKVDSLDDDNDIVEELDHRVDEIENEVERLMEKIETLSDKSVVKN